MHRLVGLILVLESFGIVGASLAQDAPVVGESGGFRVYCDAGPVCDDPQAPVFDQARAHGAQITRTLESVQDWFDDMRYPPSQLQTEGGRRVVSYARDICGVDTAACVQRLITPRMLFPREQMLQGFFDADTAAHEYSHSLHTISPALPLRWLDEAMSRAIGQEWGARNGTPFNVAAMDFELALDVPFNTPPQEGNAQGDYFQFVGDQLSIPPRLGYLRDFFTLSNDGFGGMNNLYRQALGAGSFDFSYPLYVARFNSLDKFSDGAGRFYDAVSAAKIDVGPPDMIAKFDIPRTARAFASDAVHFEAVSVDEPASGEDRDALMVAEVNLTDAERPDDLRLIFEHRPITGHSHRFLIRAGAAMDLGFVRVTNAASTAEATSTQGYTLNLELQPAEFLLPQCVETGASAVIDMREGVLENVDNFRITPSAGSVEGLNFTAPANPQKVSFSLRIRSQVTRPDSGIRPKARPDRVVGLGEVTVAKSCMIQMGQPGGVKVTYDALHDYSAYDTGEGIVMFARPGEIAAYDARKGGWQHIPPMAQAMLSGQMQSRGFIANVLDAGREAQSDDPNILARMPQIFSQRFAWAHVSALVKAARPDAPVSTPAACPAGSDATGCSVVQHYAEGRSHAITYDGERRLVGIDFGGEVMVFRYGTFEIARPPGW